MATVVATKSLGYSSNFDYWGVGTPSVKYSGNNVYAIVEIEELYKGESSVRDVETDPIPMETNYKYSADVVNEKTLRLLATYAPPPETPSSITVPTEIKGGENTTISWGSSTGATRYHLERSVDGRSFSQIYSGSSRSYTDSITKGWNTVVYRVRAYNSDGYSSYRTSAKRTIINFPELKMEINGVLKTSEAGWVKINGQLREIDKIWGKINGVLKEVE